MEIQTSDKKQIRNVSSFQDLVSIPFDNEVNALCWKRYITGDFSEIVHKINLQGNITVVETEDLLALQLSEEGNLAREIMLNDFRLLKDYGASPVLNLIQHYDRDDVNPFFATDVYSFHVDRSPVPTDTFLCTYYGEPSEIIANSQCVQKILVPEIREEIKRSFKGEAEDFESFLKENFLDLHYQAQPEAHPIKLGTGEMWRLAVDHPESRVSPCVHRAPIEKIGEPRLLLIC